MQIHIFIFINNSIQLLTRSQITYNKLCSLILKSISVHYAQLSVWYYKEKIVTYVQVKWYSLKWHSLK